MAKDSDCQRFWIKVNVCASSDCWEWKSGLADGRYGSFKLDGKTRGSHRVSFFLTHGRWPQPSCLHTCNNPKCCNPEHLYEGNQKDNMEYRDSQGRTASGEQNGSAKLTQGQADWIGARARRGRWGPGVPQSEIARMFGVSRQHVSEIVNGKNWRR